jgi:hypothetical protein
MQTLPLPQHGYDRSSVDRWVSEHMEVSTNSMAKARDLYEHYKAHADMQHVSMTAFGLELSALGIRKVRTAQGIHYALVEKESDQ